MNLDLVLYQELERDISEEVEKLAASLLDGNVTDLSDYKFRVGKIRGFRDALKLAREAQARVLGIDEHKRK